MVKTPFELGPDVHPAAAAAINAGMAGQDPATTFAVTVMVNPELELGPNPEVPDITTIEGCLSIPGLTGLVPRHSFARATYVDPFGQPGVIEAHGFWAAVCHS